MDECCTGRSGIAAGERGIHTHPLSVQFHRLGLDLAIIHLFPWIAALVAGCAGYMK